MTDTHKDADEMRTHNDRSNIEPMPITPSGRCRRIYFIEPIISTQMSRSTYRRMKFDFERSDNNLQLCVVEPNEASFPNT